jgi:RHH-type proline utilization regulon transcriptional repressor/proline dehydrogenase/delta 1-pyrroline-5-carboxylate dehydrogenase
LYLLRLLGRHPAGLPGWCKLEQNGTASLTLPGPTGESNIYYLKPRGTVLCVAATEAGAMAQFNACQITGNRMSLRDSELARRFVDGLDAAGKATVDLVPAESEKSDFHAVLFEGDSDALRELNFKVAQRKGPIVSVQGLRSEEIASGASYRLERLLREVSVSVNTAAAGGNASLMMVG